MEIITTKDDIIMRQKKQIKKIQAQNRRLKKKVNKIEDIMNDLQKKFFMRNEELETLKTSNIQVCFNFLFSNNPYNKRKNAVIRAYP